MADYNEALSEISGYPKALSHAGSGGNVTLKTITFQNEGNTEIIIKNAIVDGLLSSVTVPANGTADAQYVEPIDDDREIMWLLQSDDGAFARVSLTGMPEQFDVSGANFATIFAGLPENTVVVFRASD